jgi:hypothetical protein
MQDGFSYSVDKAFKSVIPFNSCNGKCAGLLALTKFPDQAGCFINITFRRGSK